MRKTFQILIYIIGLLCIIGSASAQQNVPFDKSHFPEDAEKLKEAQKNINIAVGLIEIEQNYKEAIRYFKKAERFNTNNSELHFNLGFCYYMLSPSDTESALIHWKKSIDIQPVFTPKVYFNIGRVYHLKQEWNEAISYYQNFLKEVDEKTHVQEVILTNKYLEECQSGKKLAAQPTNSLISNLGNLFNTKYPDYGPVVHPNGLTMYYCSRRKNRDYFEIADDNLYYEDIFISKRYSEEDDWKRGKLADDNLNSKGHESVVSISNSGKTLLVHKGSKQGDLYFSKIEGKRKKTITSPVKLPAPINSEYAETSACFSPDGRFIYFSSDRPDGKGGKDLYVSERKNGQWSTPTNLSALNTPYDEEGPYLTADGKQLFFSSKGHNSIGGFDLFVSENLNGEWQTPENLGVPINTPYDEVYISAPNGFSQFYFSSDRPEGYGYLDIYSAAIIGTRRQPQLISVETLLTDTKTYFEQQDPIGQLKPYTLDLTIVKGTVVDAATGKPLNAQVQISNNEKQEVTGKFATNRAGKVVIVVPKGKNYGAEIKSDGYLFYSENFTAANSDTSVVFKLQPLKKGSKIVLKNMFFKPGSYELSELSKIELENIAKFLRENPKLQIEISGHTDNTGSVNQNEKLSHQRARSVVEFLKNMQIPASRMKYFGYAAEQPIADNTTEEGRKMNRRTELKIIN
ncbi:OmpA family protein [Limibacter armeniacum]|uniref:OmpA family protein n=1 Tax=Limibacter armeniacum TaxID=466084 RepID=UPI002FE68EEF